MDTQSCDHRRLYQEEQGGGFEKVVENHISVGGKNPGCASILKTSQPVYININILITGELQRKIQADSGRDKD